MMETPAGLDPSHLLALHLLLSERHVTRAAQRLGITQSSMSHRLRILRDALGDPLLVRAGASLVLTPRAESIAAPLAAAIEGLEVAVAPPASFDPGQSHLHLAVAMPDLLMPLVPSLLTHLRREAPRLALRIAPVPTDLSGALGQGACDLALTPEAFASPSIIQRPVGQLRFGVVGRRGHPALRGRLTTARWLAEGHVVVAHDNDSQNVIEQTLGGRGLKRSVALQVPSFLAGLSAVAASDLLMNAPRPLVDEALEGLGLQVTRAPIAIPPIPFALLWHERQRADPAHRWARAQVFSWVRRRFRG